MPSSPPSLLDAKTGRINSQHRLLTRMHFARRWLLADAAEHDGHAHHASPHQHGLDRTLSLARSISHSAGRDGLYGCPESCGP